MTQDTRHNPQSGTEPGKEMQDIAPPGHDQTLADICREQTQFLARYFLARGAVYDDVQDLVQETFTVFWTRRDSVQPGKAKAFLTGIARNTLLAHKRKANTHATITDTHLPEITQHIHPAPGAPDSLLHTAEQIEQLQRLINQLPPRMAQVLRLRHLEGRSHAEIADALGVSPQTAKNAHSEAIRRLRILLDED